MQRAVMDVITRGGPGIRSSLGEAEGHHSQPHPGPRAPPQWEHSQIQRNWQQRRGQDAEGHRAHRRVTGQVRATSTLQPRRSGSKGSTRGLEEKGLFIKAQSLDGTQPGRGIKLSTSESKYQCDAICSLALEKAKDSGGDTFEMSTGEVKKLAKEKCNDEHSVHNLDIILSSQSRERNF